MKNPSMSFVLTVAIEFILVGGQAGSQTPQPAVVATKIPYTDAKPILETLRQDLLPPELRARRPTEIESAWPGWISQHDAKIRARLERGDEDSIVNLLLFGVTFTKQPRTKAQDILTLSAQGRSTEILQGPIVRGRLEDMVTGIASPGANERLQFARQVIERKGIDPTTPAGKNHARRYLDEQTTRVFAEYEAYARAGAPSVPFGDRGLSSDTALYSSFGIEQTLEAITSGGMLGAGSIRRVAIVGPGLDFSDKREGFDFYPQQTLQPFAVIDSLIRLGLARRDDLRVTTFDLSPRINGHLEAARQRARAGGAYLLQLPLVETDVRLNPDLVRYWTRFGGSIGEDTKPVATPPGVGSVRLRAVRVPPAVVMAITPRDVNIVLQRLEPLAANERFDLIIATNILIYYDVFEQSLALANVATMLRPGGFFLSNSSTVILPTTPMDVVGYTDVVYSDQLNDKDRLVWCRRR